MKAAPPITHAALAHVHKRSLAIIAVSPASTPSRSPSYPTQERRIYDLKKKNQELEKFKFVLDYKIKELKKQIEPREQEIADMKDQIKEMDGELERQVD